jgi:hypothetical protein
MRTSPSRTYCNIHWSKAIRPTLLPNCHRASVQVKLSRDGETKLLLVGTDMKRVGISLWRSKLIARHPKKPIKQEHVCAGVAGSAVYRMQCNGDDACRRGRTHVGSANKSSYLPEILPAPSRILSPASLHAWAKKQGCPRGQEAGMPLHVTSLDYCCRGERRTMEQYNWNLLPLKAYQSNPSIHCFLHPPIPLFLPNPNVSSNLSPFYITTPWEVRIRSKPEIPHVQTQQWLPQVRCTQVLPQAGCSNDHPPLITILWFRSEGQLQ